MTTQPQHFSTHSSPAFCLTRRKSYQISSSLSLIITTAIHPLSHIIKNACLQAPPTTLPTITHLLIISLHYFSFAASPQFLLAILIPIILISRYSFSLRRKLWCGVTFDVCPRSRSIFTVRLSELSLRCFFLHPIRILLFTPSVSYKFHTSNYYTEKAYTYNIL